ncbi:hypothetical protein ACIQNU_15000 [Streptomyces sp. NPDC091292]|uniref:hypothetical protein n=1 Tax=Streptomyces sp. NPDC091292 TaxID=3365991 RepID=UPI00382D9EDD
MTPDGRVPMRAQLGWHGGPLARLAFDVAAVAVAVAVAVQLSAANAPSALLLTIAADVRIHPGASMPAARLAEAATDWTHE